MSPFLSPLRIMRLAAGNDQCLPTFLCTIATACNFIPSRKQLLNAGSVVTNLVRLVMAHIGFIGLGHMGNPMVRNLLKQGHTVKVYDVMPAALQALTAQGAIAAHSVKEVAEGVDALITMLQTGEQVTQCCHGQE